MAVLVRSATRQVPVLQRALAAAGVPVTVAGDELPLTAEPGTRPLLTLLDCALRPGALDEQAAAELLTGPLGGTDALGLRRLRRWLRAAAQAAGQPPPEEPLAPALRDPRELALAGDGQPGAAGRARRRRRRTARGLAGDRTRGGGGGPPDVRRGWRAPHAALGPRRGGWRRCWRSRRRPRTGPRTTCSGRCGTPPGWRPSGSRPARRAAAAARPPTPTWTPWSRLFDAAARFTARLPQGSPRLFLDSMAGQEIAGDTLAERASRGEGVAVLTAHRAKGLEWDLVVVAGVQEGTWPDVRTRGSLLSMDELVDAVGPASGGRVGAEMSAGTGMSTGRG